MAILAGTAMIESVHALSAGYCSHPESMTRVGAPLHPCRFPSGFALIVHARYGPILFDTGYGANFTRATQTYPERFYRYLTPVHIDDSETARSQLASLGIPATDVRTIVISHFHADHIAALADFPRARIYATHAAWMSIAGRSRLSALVRGHLPALLPNDIEDRLTFVDETPAIAAPASYSAFGVARDIFADRAILALDLPGHAVGQIGLALPEAPNGPWFFVADAAWSLAAVRTAVPPPRVTTMLLGDTRTYRSTLANLATLARSEPTLRIVPSHAA